VATVVGAFVMPHDPMMYSNPDGPDASVRDGIFAAYDEVARRIASLRATTVIVIGTDHYILFGPGCLPQFLIATGDVEGPVERLPGLERRRVATNSALAKHIAAHGHLSGVDWAVAPTFTADHSVVIPYARCVEPHALPMIPVYLACGVEPLLPLRRAEEIGRQIRTAIEQWDGDERVVVIGSGGISHWVGTADMGKVNHAFDRRILDLVASGDTAGLASLSDAEIVAEGGNGALEIRNFVAAMASVGPCRGEVIHYAAVPEWITGLGFAAIMPVASDVGPHRKAALNAI
jgi:protocatechuate 4,5-dioxygenase, beta chain